MDIAVYGVSTMIGFLSVGINEVFNDIPYNGNDDGFARIIKLMDQWYLVIMTWLLSVVSGWSFWKISKNFKTFHAMGIIVNKKFMASYFVLMLFCAIPSTIAISLDSYINKIEKERNQEPHCDQTCKFTVLVIKYSFNSITIIFLFVLHLMMLVIYMKYSHFKK